MSRAPLLSILAHARAGAVDHAWRLLEECGLADHADDPLILCIRGRLLKDLAMRRTGPDRAGLHFRAADAYEHAAALKAASYPLINAATLYFLSGDASRAEALARTALDLIERHPEEPETPYYRAATRAEALLLLGREAGSRVAVAEAIALAPRAWEDHASTLRQFALILSAQDRDPSWLDDHRPPRSLHFGGHMSFDPGVARREQLDKMIAAVIEEENIGFGYGALAAGADIIIAEALIARGAELHAVLPGGAEAFAALSVDPFGKAWRRRFDAVLAEAETVRPVRPLGIEPNAAMIGLAAEVAMGRALMNGRRLESSAVQLLLLSSGDGGDGASWRSRDIWAAGGWRQRVLTAPREIPAEVPASIPEPAAPLAVLALGLGMNSPLDEGLAALVGKLAKVAPPAFPPYLTEDRLMLAYRHPGEAAETSVRLLSAASDTLDLRIGGQYGHAEAFRDPLSGAVRLVPSTTAAAAAAFASAPPGTAVVTDDFAAALAAAGPRRPASEFIGELDPSDEGPPIGLYALKSYDRFFQPLGSEDGQ